MLVADDESGQHAYNLGYFYQKMERWLDAEKWYGQAVTKGDAWAMNGLALILDKRGETEKAVELLRRSDELGNGKALINLARIYYDRGNLAEAKLCLSESIDKGSFEACSTLGYLHQVEGNHGEAVRYWRLGAEKGVELSCFNYAFALQQDGFLREAKKYYEQSHLAVPSAAYNLVRLLQDEGDLDKAERIFEAAIEQLEPSDACSLTRGFRGAPYVQKRIAWYQASLERGHAHAGCPLGHLLLHTGSPVVEVEEAWRRAYDNGDHPHAADQLSKLMLELGRGKDAAIWLRRSHGAAAPVQRNQPKRRRRQRKK